jgi:hypothetical protein
MDSLNKGVDYERFTKINNVSGDIPGDDELSNALTERREKNKKFRILFDDLEKWSLNQYGAKVSLLGPSSQKDIAEMKREYLDPIEKELVGSIEGRFMAPKEDF